MSIKLRDKVQSVKVLIDQDSIEESTLINRDGIPYYRGKLVEPIMARCSTMPEESAIECDEVYFLEDLLDADWQVDEKTNGVYLENDKNRPYVVDYSTTHSVVLYQETHISQWIRNQRKESRASRLDDNKSVLQKLRDRSKK